MGSRSARRVFVVVTSLATLADCAPRTAGLMTAAPGVVSVVTTYEGTIPCADCEGQRVTLTLFPDSTFRQRTTYLGSPDGPARTAHSAGRWHAATGGGLVLVGAANAPGRFQVQPNGALRLLDSAGHPIASAHNYDLTRQPAIDRVDGPMRLNGMYVYEADAATLVECGTEKRFPVLLEGDHQSLERAYLGARRQPGEAMLAAFTGRFVERAPEPGMRERDVLTVDTFERVWPGATCATVPVEVAWHDTRWRPVEIDGAAVTHTPGQPEPYLRFSAEGRRVEGSSGCNRLSGGFEDGDASFRFTGLALTRMMCLPPANDLEGAFVAALNAVTSRRMIGNTLELLDAGGAVRTRFEATDPR